MAIINGVLLENILALNGIRIPVGPGVPPITINKVPIFRPEEGGGTGGGGGTTTETQYAMYIDIQIGQQIFMGGVDQSSTWPPGFIYPVLLTDASIDPQNLVILDISDPYPWAITVYADSTNLTVGDMSSDGGYQPLWPPDVLGGGG